MYSKMTAYVYQKDGGSLGTHLGPRFRSLPYTQSLLINSSLLLFETFHLTHPTLPPPFFPLAQILAVSATKQIISIHKRR